MSRVRSIKESLQGWLFNCTTTVSGIMILVRATSWQHWTKTWTVEWHQLFWFLYVLGFDTFIMWLSTFWTKYLWLLMLLKNYLITRINPSNKGIVSLCFTLRNKSLHPKRSLWSKVKNWKWRAKHNSLPIGVAPLFFILYPQRVSTYQR